jgi:hypothetical protein
MPRDGLRRLLDDVLLRRRRGRRLTGRDRRLGLGWRRLGRRWLGRRRFGGRRFSRDDWRLGRGWNRFRFWRGRRRRGFGRRRRLGFWRLFKNHLDPALRNRLRQRRLAGEEQRQRDQASGMSGER